jgi:hypothetical protein
VIVWESCHPERSEGAEAVVACQPFGLPRLSGPLPLAARWVRVTARLLFVLLFLASCSSPEATRTRGGGPGADVKNWEQPVEMHEGAEPYYDTPCVTDPVECHGPRAVFGPTPAPD